MAGHTHVGFRTLVRELGSCGLVCSELISSHALEVAPTSRKSQELFDWSEREHPFAVQLFGSNPVEMAKAARVVVDRGAPIVDINMGCWVPKVARKGGGAALLNDLPRATAVVEAVCSEVSVPVTVKIRLGVHPSVPTAMEFSQAAARAGVALITVHGRYADQGFKGDSNHEIVGEIRRQLPTRVKVIANGDIVDVLSAQKVIDSTGCDGIMLGRAALHKPWLFSILAAALCQNQNSLSSWSPVQVARRHVELTRELVAKPEPILVRELRGQLLPYGLGCHSQRGIDHATSLRNELLAAKTILDLQRFLDRVQSLEEIL